MDSFDMHLYQITDRFYICFIQPTPISDDSGKRKVDSQEPTVSDFINFNFGTHLSQIQRIT